MLSIPLQVEIILAIIKMKHDQIINLNSYSFSIKLDLNMSLFRETSSIQKFINFPKNVKLKMYEFCGVSVHIMYSVIENKRCKALFGVFTILSTEEIIKLALENDEYLREPNG